MFSSSTCTVTFIPKWEVNWNFRFLMHWLNLGFCCVIPLLDLRMIFIFSSGGSYEKGFFVAVVEECCIFIMNDIVIEMEGNYKSDERFA